MREDEKLDCMANRRNALRDQGKKQYLDQSRDRLSNILTTKLKTTMIGALHQFELVFGHLWGHGKPNEELTEEEKSNRQKWNDLRTEVLNNGNNQIRGMKEELRNNTIHWNRYRTEIRPVY